MQSVVWIAQQQALAAGHPLCLQLKVLFASIHNGMAWIKVGQLNGAWMQAVLVLARLSAGEPCA